MLHTRDPLTIISRILSIGDDGRVECECFRLGEGNVVLRLETDEIIEQKRGDLAEVLMNPSRYQPSREEVRWWIDELRQWR